jgi:imidazolonepropionase-like amidohydrolase
MLINPGRDRSEHRTMRVSEGRIEAIGNIAAGKGDALSAYAGMYVLPGLIDMHSHLPPDNPLQLSSYFTLLNLAHGVTSIRNAGDLDGTAMRAYRDALAKGYPDIRMFFCDAFISSGKKKWANTILLENPQAADGVAAALKAKGASCIKAYDGLTLPLIDALRIAAEQHGLTLIGHVPQSLRYEQALLPDVQHLMGIAPARAGSHLYLSDGWDQVDDARLEAIVRVTRAQRLANTPTLVLGQQLLLLEHYDQARSDPAARLLPRLFRDVIWHPIDGLAQYRGMAAADFERLRAAQRQKLRLVRMLHDAGAALYLGTDTLQPFVVPGKSLQQEMQLFVDAGIPLDRVWALATRESGLALREPGLGSLEVGAPADLLIFRDDPTRALEALDSLQAVVSNGRLYSRPALDAKIAEYQAHYSSPLFDRLSVILARLALRQAVAD